MLAIDKVQLIEGVTVYGDNQRFNKFYLLPDTPRFRLDDDGLPVFKFIKYRMPVDRPDGKKGGGFCFFDVEFMVDEDKIEPIREKLQEQVNRRFRDRDRQPPPVEFGTITYTKGEAQLLLQADDGVLIERVTNPGKPSLYGRNITPFSLELSPEGATLFWEAMQGRGGVIQVAYDLHFNAALPPITARGWFNASKFYEFHQEIDIEWRFWREDDYRETIREQFVDSESMGVSFEWGQLTDEKQRQTIRDWALRTVEDAAERKMIDAISPVPEDARKKPDGIENVTRDISVHKISNFSLYFKESQPVEWFVGPRGTLPNITNMTDADGNPLEWSDFASKVELNDPFFRQLNLKTHVNADFDNLPIHSVKVHVDYGDEPGDFLFTSADDVGEFNAFLVDDNRDYDFWYEVNYEGESRRFKAEPETTNEEILTINVGDLGILDIQLQAGDINFEQVREAQVTVAYEDSGVDPIEEQFTLDEDNRESRFQKVVFEPTRRPYRYKVKYFMTDGKEYEVDWAESRSEKLFINDPWSSSKTIGLRAAGDLDETIRQIFVDLVYSDEDNDYRQEKSVALSADNPFFNWVFPVIDEDAGTVTYSGVITYRDGTTEQIERTEAEAATVLVGDLDARFLDIKVLANLVKLGEEVALVQVMLRYDDDDNDVHEAKDFIFDPDNKAPQTWRFGIEDAAKNQYRWEAVFFMSDGSERRIPESATDAQTLVLRTPEA